jgi:SAM-dependent methyltransferase
MQTGIRLQKARPRGFPMDRRIVAGIKSFLPDRAISRGKKWRAMINAMRDFGGKHPRECPICDYQGWFFADGQPLVYDAVCPRCRSIGRHRQHHLLVEQHQDWIEGKVVLHFSPEPCFIQKYHRRATRYLPADYMPTRDEIAVDIQRMQFEDSSIDLIICHNIVEHVPDDGRALSEMFRVLRPLGIALISTPVIEAWERTYENPTITDYWGRDLHFNQWDHLRYYGRDISDRIRHAGFELELDIAKEPAVNRYGLVRGETIFISRKPA